KKGKSFDLGDLRDQFEQMLNMGGIGAMLEKLPLGNLGNINQAALKDTANEQVLRRQVAIINSMTREERRFPKTINGSRKRRIAKGSGQEIQDVNRLLKQHLQMEKMMKKMSKGGMKKMMRGLPDGPLPHRTDICLRLRRVTKLSLHFAPGNSKTRRLLGPGPRARACLPLNTNKRKGNGQYSASARWREKEPVLPPGGHRQPQPPRRS